MVDTEPKLTKLDFIAKIPGIQLESNFDKIIGPQPDQDQKKGATIAERCEKGKK